MSVNPFGITEDHGLLLAGLLATTSLLVAQRRQSSHPGRAAAMTTWSRPFAHCRRARRRH